MGSVTVTTRAGFRALEKGVDDVARIALDEIGAVAEGLVKENMTDTVDRRGYRGRVASGSTRQAVTAREPRKTNRGWEQVTEVAPPQDKVAAIVELGRRKGKGVSRQGQRMIERWARRKLGPVSAGDGKRFKAGGRARAEQSRAYLIARAIKRRGIPALHPFKRAADELKDGLARRMWNDVASRVFKGRGDA